MKGEISEGKFMSKVLAIKIDIQKQIEILNQSIVNGWQGIFPLKEEGQENKPQKKQKKNSFHNFNQRSYDYEAMERMLLNQQQAQNKPKAMDDPWLCWTCEEASGNA